MTSALGQSRETKLSRDRTHRCITSHGMDTTRRMISTDGLPTKRKPAIARSQPAVWQPAYHVPQEVPPAKRTVRFREDIRRRTVRATHTTRDTRLETGLLKDNNAAVRGGSTLDRPAKPSCTDEHQTRQPKVKSTSHSSSSDKTIPHKQPTNSLLLRPEAPEATEERRFRSVVTEILDLLSKDALNELEPVSLRGSEDLELVEEVRQLKLDETIAEDVLPLRYPYQSPEQFTVPPDVAMDEQDGDTAPPENLSLVSSPQPPSSSVVLPDINMDEQDGDTAPVEDMPLVSSPEPPEPPAVLPDVPTEEQDSAIPPVEDLPLVPYLQPPTASTVLPDVVMDEQDSDAASVEDMPLSPWPQPAGSSAVLPDVPMEGQNIVTTPVEGLPLDLFPQSLEPPAVQAIGATEQ